jgi:hypothetical protein
MNMRQLVRIGRGATAPAWCVHAGPRCASCPTAHVLLPAWCLPRRADAGEVIGAALVAKADGHGYRSIAARLDRRSSTVRAWLRRTRGGHVAWLRRRGVELTQLDTARCDKPQHRTSTQLPRRVRWRMPFSCAGPCRRESLIPASGGVADRPNVELDRRAGLCRGGLAFERSLQRSPAVVNSTTTFVQDW